MLLPPSKEALSPVAFPQRPPEEKHEFLHYSVLQKKWEVKVYHKPSGRFITTRTLFQDEAQKIEEKKWEKLSRDTKDFFKTLDPTIKNN